MFLRELIFLYYTCILGYDYSVDKALALTSKKGDIISYSANNVYKIIKVDKKTPILYMKRVLK